MESCPERRDNTYGIPERRDTTYGIPALRGGTLHIKSLPWIVMLVRIVMQVRRLMQVRTVLEGLPEVCIGGWSCACQHYTRKMVQLCGSYHLLQSAFLFSSSPWPT